MIENYMVKYIKQSRQTYGSLILSISLGYISRLISRNIWKVLSRMKEVINNNYPFYREALRYVSVAGIVESDVTQCKKKNRNVFHKLIDINTSCFFHMKERNDIGRVKPLPSITRWYLQNMYQTIVFVSEHTLSLSLSLSLSLARRE